MSNGTFADPVSNTTVQYYKDASNNVHYKKWGASGHWEYINCTLPDPNSFVSTSNMPTGGTLVLFTSPTAAASRMNGISNPLPVGCVIDFAINTVADANWLLCNGASFSATTYPLLAAVYPGLTLPNVGNGTGQWSKVRYGALNVIVNLTTMYSYVKAS